MEIVITKYEKVDIDPRKVIEQLYGIVTGKQIGRAHV